MYKLSLTAALGISCLAFTCWIAIPTSATAGLDETDTFQLAQQRGGPRARQESGKYDEMSGRSPGAPQVGEDAPDFSLTPLKFYEFGIDNEDITKENAGKLYQPVSLSEFRGKKPVVLIFGSYT